MKRYFILVLIVSTFISGFTLGCNSVTPSVAVSSQESSLLTESAPAEYEQQISDLEQQVSSLTKRVSDLEKTVGSLEGKVKMYSIIVSELEINVDKEMTQIGEQQYELTERLEKLDAEFSAIKQQLAVE